MMKTRKLHRVIGLVMLLPLFGWALTGFIFFVKPGYEGAYELLQPKTYPMGDEKIAVTPDASWLEFRCFKTILGNHLLVRTDNIKQLRKEIGNLHGRTARFWNSADNAQGRQVWFNFFDRDMKSNGHFWASLNYIHHNPVHHGYTHKWQDWIFSSANNYLEKVGHERAAHIWRTFPILDYGKDWDIY